MSRAVIGLSKWGEGGKGSVRLDRLLTIEQCAAAIAHKGKTAEIVERIRACDDKDGRNELKKDLRALWFHAVYAGGYRDTAHAAGLTGYLCLDFDQDGIDYTELRDELAADEYLQPVLMFSSPSGKLKCVLRVEGLENTPRENMAEEFAKWYRGAASYCRFVYGVRVDTSCLDLARNCWMSHDPKPFLNPSGRMGARLVRNERENLMRWEEMKAEERAEKEGVKNRGFRASSWEMPAEFKDKYIRKLNAIRNSLTVGEDGDWVYDRAAKVTGIGSRSAGTANIVKGDCSGYELKWRIHSVACWLYGRRDEAQAWVEAHFPEARNHGTWTPITRSNYDKPPKLEVLRWVLRELKFARKWTSVEYK